MEGTVPWFEEAGVSYLREICKKGQFSSQEFLKCPWRFKKSDIKLSVSCPCLFTKDFTSYLIGITVSLKGQPALK